MQFTTGTSRKRDKIVRLQLAPMIDVIFLLLVYFLVTTTYQPPEAELSPGLQAEYVEGGRGADFEPQIVEVGVFEGAPGFRIGTRTLRRKVELAAVLHDLPKEGGVFVRGSGRVPTEWATAAIQACRDADFQKVTYVPAP